MEPWVAEVLRTSYRIPFSSPSPLSAVPVPIPSYSPDFHQGECSPWGGSFVDGQGSGRGSSSLSGQLQPSFCCVEGNGLVETSDRPIASESLCPTNTFQDGDQPIGPPCGAKGRLDDMHRSQGCVSSVSGTSRQPSVPQVCCGWSGLSVQGPLLWPLHGPSGIRQGHGSCVSHTSRPGVRLLRYLDDCLVLASSRVESLWARDMVLNLCQQLGIVVSLAKSHLIPSRSATYLGTYIESPSLRAFPSQERVSTLRSQLAEFISYRWSLLGRLSSLCLLVLGGSTPTTFFRESLELQHRDLLFWSDASDQGWSAHLHDQFVASRWSVEECSLHQSPRTSSDPSGAPSFPLLSEGHDCGGVYRQHHIFCGAQPGGATSPRGWNRQT